MGKIEYNRVIKYKVLVKNAAPLHIGGALNNTEDILTDSITGFPFIQASSLAGMFRTVCEKNDESVAAELFGPSKAGDDINNNRGRLSFTDGNITNPLKVKYEIRPGVSIDRKTGTVMSESGSGQKYETTFLAADAEFRFYVYLYDNSDKSKSLEGDVEKMLGILTNGEARLGAKKSSGAGALEAVSIEKTEFDLTDKSGRKMWIAEDEGESEDESKDKIEYKPIEVSCTYGRSEIKYQVTINATSEGPIQVKGVAASEFGKDAPDSENIRNGNNEHIVPGSSIKGAFRSRMEKIAEQLGKQFVIENSFGYIDENDHSKSQAGNLLFNDAIIGTVEHNDGNPIRNRIHIDKFTGGVINQGFFKEKNANGDIPITIQVCDRNNPDATLGLLLFAIRDLAINMINLGNGYATGKGFLNVTSAEIKGASETVTIDFKNKQGNDKELVKKVLNALKEAQDEN